MFGIKRLRECIKKKSYDNWRIAESAAMKIWEHNGKGMNIYKCELCEKYHLTSQRS